MGKINPTNTIQKYAYIITARSTVPLQPDSLDGTYVITGEFDSAFALQMFHSLVDLDPNKYDVKITTARRLIEVTTIAQFGPDMILKTPTIIFK